MKGFPSAAGKEAATRLKRRLIRRELIETG
jgi:hypothetical protein